MIEPYITRALVTWEGCDDATRAQGRAWYPDFRRTCTTRGRAYGLGTGAYAAVFAGCSPANTYAGNLSMADAILQGRGWLDTSVKVMPAHAGAVRVAQAALQGHYPSRYWLGLLNGRKVRAFYGAIMGHQQGDCVVDRHMARMLGDEFGVKSRYHAMSAALVEAARLAGEERHGFQAALWINERGSGDP